MVTDEGPDRGSDVSGGGERVWDRAGATRLYVCPRRDQLFLLPVCMRDWLEEGHLAWFVLDVVAVMDLAASTPLIGRMVMAARRMSRR